MTRFYTILLSIVLALSASCSSTSSQQQPRAPAPQAQQPQSRIPPYKIPPSPEFQLKGHPPSPEEQLQEVEALEVWVESGHYFTRRIHSPSHNEGYLRALDLLKREKKRLQKALGQNPAPDPFTPDLCLPSKMLISVQGPKGLDSLSLYRQNYLPTMRKVGDLAAETALITDVNSVLEVVSPGNKFTCIYRAYDGHGRQLTAETKKVVKKYAEQYKGRVVIRPKIAEAAGLDPSEVSRHFVFCTHDNQNDAACQDP